MNYCNVARIPTTIPLISRVSKRTHCSKLSRSSTSPSFSSFKNGNEFEPSLRTLQKQAVASSNGFQRRSTVSLGFRLKTLRSCIFLRPRNYSIECLGRTMENGTVVKSRSFLIGARVFSSGSPQRTRENGEKRLPWIAAYRNREGTRGEKRNTGKSSRSSWEESADTYFSRKERREDRDGSVENQEFRKKFNAKDDKWEEGVVEEEDNAEPVDDPRWDKIRSTYKGFIDRESRFERPEVQRWNKQENWGRKTWKEATESSALKMVGQGVYGVGPVLAALMAERREFYVLYVQEGLDLSGNNRKKKDKKGVEKVLKLAEKIGLKVTEASKHDLNMVVDNRPHQGLVLDASPLEMVNVRDLEPVSMESHRSAPLWVALDEVTDPQNLGAIVRSAYFFGVEGVVLCAKNSAPLTGVVSKASAGSLELIELRSCKNMMQFLSSSIENGWRVLGGSVSSRALPLSEVEAGVPTILVLGSEGSGLRPLVERSCTQLIRIPGSTTVDGCAGEVGLEVEETNGSHAGQELKSFLAVESLNVSVAAGVLLYHLVGNNSHIVGEKPNIALE